MRKENFQRFGFEFRKGKKVFHLSGGHGKTLCGRGFYNLNMFPDEVRICKTCVKCVRITRVSGRSVAIFRSGGVMEMLEGKKEKRIVGHALNA
jgi:hypothetical protein